MFDFKALSWFLSWSLIAQAINGCKIFLKPITCTLQVKDMVVFEDSFSSWYSYLQKVPAVLKPVTNKFGATKSNISIWTLPSPFLNLLVSIYFDPLAMATSGSILISKTPGIQFLKLLRFVRRANTNSIGLLIVSDVENPDI